MTTREIKTISEFLELLQQDEPLINLAFHNLDLTEFSRQLMESDIRDSLFLGCELGGQVVCKLQDHNYIFPKLDLPYKVYPNHLYTPEELYSNFTPDDPASYENTMDQRIYRHFLKTGKYSSDLKESLARSLHDQSITNALEDLLILYDPKSVIAVMGGHQMPRTSPQYRKIVLLAQHLTEQGKLMLSGGGPGAMEATHVGAWLAGKTQNTVLQVLDILGTAPEYHHERWLSTAFEVLNTFEGGEKPSLGIPTWLYGHEPPTPFASHIAKYFTNSIREEGLLALAKGGIVFTPGRAGTMQEVFQEVTQNHYLTLDYASPMVFMDRAFWTRDWPVYPILYKLSVEDKLHHLDLGLYDELGDIIDHLFRFYDQE